MYWTSRVILSGCIQSLDLVAPFPSLDMVHHKEAAIQAVKNITMCVEYSFRVNPKFPFPQMITLLVPLKTAFGARQRLAVMSGTQGEDARSAEDVCEPLLILTAINTIERRLSLAESTHDELVRRADCLAGGPVFDLTTSTVGS